VAPGWYAGVATPSIINKLCWSVTYDDGYEDEEHFHIVRFIEPATCSPMSVPELSPLSPEVVPVFGVSAAPVLPTDIIVSAAPATITPSPLPIYR
jgi:hypothetical protein